MERGKIVFFVPFYPQIKGGAEYQAKIIAIELKKMGYEVVYISNGHEVDGVANDDGFKVYQLQIEPDISDKVTLYKRFMKKVIGIIREERPNIIYQRILNTFTYRLSKYAKKTNTPFLLHIADNYSVEFGQGIKGGLKKNIFKGILQNGPRIICQTSYQVEKIKEFNYNRAAIIPNMHPPLTNEVTAKDRKQVVWIGNARPVKQLELFLKLAKDLHASDYIFHVYGKLPEDVYGSQLRKEIKKTENLEYHGSQSNENINKVLLQSGVLVNTSKSEGFSNTFIQAWMCGTPVLSLNSDPDNIMQTHGIGIDCKEDYDALSTNLKSILESNDYGLRCQKALEVANSIFSTEQNMAKFVAILDNIQHDGN